MEGVGRNRAAGKRAMHLRALQQIVLNKLQCARALMTLPAHAPFVLSRPAGNSHAPLSMFMPCCALQQQILT